jgi:hypothetical protein
MIGIGHEYGDIQANKPQGSMAALRLGMEEGQMPGQRERKGGYHRIRHS